MSDAALRDALLLVERFLSEPTSESLFRKASRVLAQALDEQERFVAPKPCMWNTLRDSMGDGVNTSALTAWGDGKRYPDNPGATLGKIAEIMRRNGVVTHANQARARPLQKEAISFGQVATQVGAMPYAAPAPSLPVAQLEPPSLAERMRGLPLDQLMDRLATWGQTLNAPGAFAAFCGELRGFIPEDGIERCMVPLGGQAAHVAHWSQGAAPPDAVTQRRMLQQFSAFCLLLMLNDPTEDVPSFLERLRRAGGLVHAEGIAEALARLNNFTHGMWVNITPDLLGSWVTAPSQAPALPPGLVVPMQHALIEVLKARFSAASWAV